MSVSLQQARLDFLVQKNKNNKEPDLMSNISLKGSSTLVGVCFNLLVNSAPWVSAAGGAGKVSKEEGRGAEAEQPSLGRAGESAYPERMHNLHGLSTFNTSDTPDN